MMLHYAKNHMSDPFSVELRADILLNISSGLVAPIETQNFLINVKQIGMEKLEEFVSERLELHPDDPSKKLKEFFDPIPQTALNTFSGTKKKTQIKMNGSVVKKFVSPEIVYQRAFAISAMRKDVTLELILSHPLTDVPLSLFKPDGCRRTTKKSDFMHILEKEVESDIVSEYLSSDEQSVIIVNGMAELQALSSKSFDNFNSLGKIFMQHIINRLRRETRREKSKIQCRW
ncbi:hypothetical protein QAD02_003665 [Eretmocerus hayati]|uniref:Uncharacterized protein n=1 Tax=Eretmocerus hayati TaxID=131215 RepID=A0ACC2NNC9_9HYME|nr:hypothetical protein QAD02_003665 [Eretmocerus hayati]